MLRPFTVSLKSKAQAYYSFRSCCSVLISWFLDLIQDSNFSFQAADDISNKVNKTLSNDELLELYGLYKQVRFCSCFFSAGIL